MMDAAEKDTPVCVITGGSTGIGLALALRFAGQGYRIVTCGRDPARLEQARQQIARIAPACTTELLDLTNYAAAAELIARAQQHCGRIDVLVNNAGYAPRAPVDQLSQDDLRHALAVNVEAIFHTTQAVWPLMRQQGGGVIINISSLASVDPFPGFSVYGACKAWVNLFTKAVADEGRPLGILVYSVALGAVETRMLRGLFPEFPAAQTLTPDEVALFIIGLCAEPMRHATGQTIFLKK